MRLLILLAALVPAAWGQSPATSIADQYRRTHDALFALFLPVAELKNDPKMTQLMNAAAEGIWAGAGQMPQFRGLIEPFTNLGGFGSACGIDTLVREAELRSSLIYRPPNARQLLCCSNGVRTMNHDDSPRAYAISMSSKPTARFSRR